MTTKKKSLRFSINSNVVQQRLGVGFSQSVDEIFGRRGAGSFFGRRKVALEGGGGSSFFNSRKVAPVPVSLEWVTQSKDVKEDASGLLIKAHDNLRTLEGQDLTRGLVAKYVVKGKRLERVIHGPTSCTSSNF